MSYGVQGYHLPGRRETRASYEHVELEAGKRGWNDGPCSFRSYKESQQARRDAERLTALNVGIYRATVLQSVRAYNKRRGAASYRL